MITFKGTPLFGQDSSPHYTSRFFGLTGTAFFWLVVMVFLAFYRPRDSRPHFKEVQIVLSNTPQAEKTSEAVPKVVPETAPKAISEAAPKAAKPEVKSEVKPEVKSEPVQYAQDPMEAFAQQTQQKQNKSFDWSIFDEADNTDSFDNSQLVQSKKINHNEPEFSGSAAEAATAASKPVTSKTSSSKDNNSSDNSQQNVSSETSNQLGNIENVSFRGTLKNGVQSESTVKSQASYSGKVHMQMSNGKSRALINPSKPVINLSEQAAATIETTKIVTISFKVLEKGNVIDIKITPEAILSAIVRDEIKEQISHWIFEPADYTATASFENKIVKQ